MPTQPKYLLSVVGEGTARAKGVLAYVAAQAFDLGTRSQYTLSISQAVPKGDVSRGVLRLKHTGYGNFETYYEPNRDLPTVDAHPAWIDRVPELAASVGKKITWQPQ